MTESTQQQDITSTETPPPLGYGPDSNTWQGRGYATQDPRRKSALLAAFLSLVPGLGQIYVGYYQRGFIHPMVIGAILSVLVATEGYEMPAYAPLAIMFLIFFWLYNIIDAWRRATLYNLTLEGLEAVNLPDDLSAPKFSGSIFGGAVVVIVSFFILLYTRFDMPFDVIQEWWPVVPMAFGGYLIFRAVQDSKNNS